MAKYYKVWLEIEEFDDETGEETDRDDLSFVLPFAASATCDTPWDAVRVAQEMHASVNQGFIVDAETIEKVRRAEQEG